MGTLSNYTGIACTRGQVCTDEQITGGKVKSFISINDPNFTIENLDESKASDPNLIQLLENDKFHTIEKNSETGQKVEETIYKGN